MTEGKEEAKQSYHPCLEFALEIKLCTSPTLTREGGDQADLTEYLGGTLPTEKPPGTQQTYDRS